MNVIKGWVNLQKSHDGYYTGADVHQTEEAARLRASPNTVGQFYFACELAPEKRKKDMSKYYEKKDMAEASFEVGVREKGKRQYRKRKDKV